MPEGFRSGYPRNKRPPPTVRLCRSGSSRLMSSSGRALQSACIPRMSPARSIIGSAPSARWLCACLTRDIVRPAFADIGAIGDRLEIAGIDAQIGHGAIVEPVQFGKDGASREPASRVGEQADDKPGKGGFAGAGARAAVRGDGQGMIGRETHGELLIVSERSALCGVSDLAPHHQYRSVFLPFKGKNAATQHRMADGTPHLASTYILPAFSRGFAAPRVPATLRSPCIPPAFARRRGPH